VNFFYNFTILELPKVNVKVSVCLPKYEVRLREKNLELVVALATVWRTLTLHQAHLLR